MNKFMMYAIFLALLLLFANSGSAQTSDVEKANLLYQKGLLLNNCDSSIYYYSQAILFNPNVSDYYYKRARCYYEKHEDDKAILDFSKSISLKEGANNLFDRGLVYLQIFDEDRSNINNAQSALNDFLKVKSKFPNFEQEQVEQYINELNLIIPGHSNPEESKYEYSRYADLGNNLYLFHLSKEKSLYMKLPLIQKAATYNIIKQDPYATGEGSGEFLLRRGNKQQFLDTFVSCVNIIQNEGKLFIMTIDNSEQIGIQEDLTYGSELNNLKSPDEHYTWFGKYGGSNATGWLKFDKDINENSCEINYTAILNIVTKRNGEPIRVEEYYIEGAENNNRNFKATTELNIPVKRISMIYINVKLENDRWLVDANPTDDRASIMDGYELYVNNVKISKECVKLTTSNGIDHLNYHLRYVRE